MTDTAITYAKREKMPTNRGGKTRAFRVGEAKGYLTVNCYDDGRPGEVFIRMAKTGSFTSGVVDTLAILISHSLQHGMDMAVVCESLMGLRYEPWGDTNDPEIPHASSISDYIGQRLALDYASTS